MKQEQHNSHGNSPEYQDQAIQQLAAAIDSIALSQDQQRLDRLVEQGFDWKAAVRLIGMREHLYENTEMLQRIADNKHMQFMRWLYEQGEISEEDEHVKN